MSFIPCHLITSPMLWERLILYRPPNNLNQNFDIKFYWSSLKFFFIAIYYFVLEKQQYENNIISNEFYIELITRED